MRRVLPITSCIIFILLGTFAFSSCSSKKIDKIPHTAFISHYEKNETKEKPFLSFWTDKKLIEKTIQQKKADNSGLLLYIKPVTLDFLVKTEDTKEYAKDIAELQSYFDSSLAKAFAKREKSVPSFKFVNKPAKGAWTLEVAITSINPTPTKGNVLGQALGAVKGAAGLVVGQIKKTGYITMAAKFLSPEGKRLAELADYQEDHSTIYGIDLKDFSHFSHHKKTIEVWSRELAESFTSPAGTKVKGAPLFSIVPF